MSTLLSHHVRRAAKRHTCGICYRAIVAGDKYADQRCAEDGRAYTFRSHLGCLDAWCSWRDEDGITDLVDLSDGHLPPCPLAWAPPGYHDTFPQWRPDDRVCECPPRLTPGANDQPLPSTPPEATP